MHPSIKRVNSCDQASNSCEDVRVTVITSEVEQVVRPQTLHVGYSREYKIKTFNHQQYLRSDEQVNSCENGRNSCDQAANISQTLSPPVQVVRLNSCEEEASHEKAEKVKSVKTSMSTLRDKPAVLPTDIRWGGEELAASLDGSDYMHEPREPHAHSMSEKDDDPCRVRWNGPLDPANPMNWLIVEKIGLTMLVFLLVLNITLASTIQISGIGSMSLELNASFEVTTLVTTLFLLSFVFGPLLWAPLSQRFGRRLLSIGTLLVACAFCIGPALAKNIQTLLITRFFSGFFASASLVCAAGVLIDIWDIIDIWRAICVFVGAVFFGPILGSVIGGYIVESFLGWRWAFWLLTITTGACGIACFMFLPETYAPVLLKRHAQYLRRVDPITNRGYYADLEREAFTVRWFVKRAVCCPIYVLFHEMIIFWITLYLLIIFGLFYALFEIFPFVFITRHHFTLAQNGLTYISIGIGIILGCIFSFIYSSSWYRSSRRDSDSWRVQFPPERWLIGAIIGSVLFVVSTFWFGWTGNYASVHWIVPLLAAAFWGISVVMIFISFAMYIITSYRSYYSISALSIIAIVCFIVAAAFPLFTRQMVKKLNVAWTSTLFGCLGLLFMLIPWVLYKYGEGMRSRSPFTARSNRT